MKTTINKQLFLLTLFLFPFLVMGQDGQISMDEVGPFKGVSTSGNIAVLLSQGDEYAIEVETTADQYNDVRIRVRNEILELAYTGKKNRPDKITVNVTAPEYTELLASGVGSLTSQQTLFSPSLRLTGSGAANIKLSIDTEMLSSDFSGAVNATLSGRALRHDFKGSGASLINAVDLITEVTDCVISGASNARVHTISDLQVNASGASRLEYSGEPLSRQITTSTASKVVEIGVSETSEARTRPDTILVRVGQREVHVVEGKDQKTHVTVKRRQQHLFRNNWQGVDIGINGLLSPGNSINLPPESEQFDLDYRKSIALNVNLAQQNFVFANGHMGLITGIGLGWNNYRFLTNDVLVKGTQEVEFEPGQYEFKKNKLTVTRLNVPLLLEFQTSSRKRYQRFHLSGGVIGGLRIGSHTKQMVFIDGSREKFKNRKDFHIHPFHLDATANIGWGNQFSLFANYALTPLFKDGRAPELIPFSVGLRLSFN